MTKEGDIRTEAWKCHKKGDLRRSEQLYRRLITQGPQDQDIANLGALLRHEGRRTEAKALYKEWIEKFPISLNLTINAVNCMLEENENITARKWTQNALTKYPDNKYLKKAMIQCDVVNLGDFFEANLIASA